VREYVTTVTQKGQVTIPAPIRKGLKIKPKDRVAFDIVDGEIRLRPAKSPVEASYRAVKPLTRPEDFRRLRRDFEEGVAEEVAQET